jgi:CheY-like chemotaxis protein
VLLYKPVRRRALRDVLEAAQTNRASADTRLETDLPAAGGMHVLVVEDNLVNQMVAQAMLAELGATCVIAHDGREALQCAASERFDLVLMDIQMPVLDGLAATRALRDAEAASGRPRLTVVAMTANSEVDEKELCVQAGMDDFLSKPFGIANLRRCLQRWKSVRTP